MQLILALLVLAAAWSTLRHQAATGSGAGRMPACWALLPLDAAPIALTWWFLLATTDRPVTSAIAVAAIAAGLLVADVVKRTTLKEPLVFADRAELLEVVRHPGLYLPFAGPARVIGGAMLALAAIAVLLWLEPAWPSPSPLLPGALILVATSLPAWPPALAALARLYRAAHPTEDPATDMRRFGFLACLIVHATLARHERPGRRAAMLALPAATPGGPLILVQLESFFDARRLGPPVPPNLLPGFDALERSAVQSGLLDVPCWGANTVRTEFAVLTGTPQATLGLDRFNPYERFAQLPIASLAWQMKRAGYRTFCVHPFDKGFYARDRVMPLLGFDEFRGPAAFVGAATTGPYVSDEAVAQEVIRILGAHGPRVFVFAITMGNHGPWDAAVHPPVEDWPDALDAIPEAGPLRHFAAGLQATDRMLPPLMAAMPAGGLLAVYGDHQPSLPAAFAAIGFDDPRTDYAIFRPGAAQPGEPSSPHTDLRAQDLASLLLNLHGILPCIKGRDPAPEQEAGLLEAMHGTRAEHSAHRGR